MDFSKPTPFEIRQIKSVLAYQYGTKGQDDLGESFFQGVNITVGYSHSTGRVRYVYDDKIHLLTIRARDGLLTLSINGAQKLLELLPKPKARIVVLNEVASFISAGRSVFAKHIVDCDPKIRSQDEVIAVNEDGLLLGVGISLLPAQSLLDFNSGVAVKIRHGSGLV